MQKFAENAIKIVVSKTMKNAQNGPKKGNLLSQKLVQA